ncbi:T9SS sorting signal type C domain-containing protein [Flavobacterium sp.]|jgi:hypothetical protein|uniref:T9SS sorting signal type C domain-containing protein n=1 Tax=Flavobacterium sp. TaxID=239 RepID=UPI0037BF8007
MKNKITLLLLFALTSFGVWAQSPSVSFTSVPTSTPVGTSITINYKYSVASAGKLICGINLYNDWTYISTVGYAELNPAVAGTDVVGSFTVLIPSGTTPTASLTGLQNYKINLELKDASNNWLAGDYSVQNYNFTAAVVPSVSVTSIPTSTKVGTNLVLNYKYTAAATGKVTIGVFKNGGVNAWDYISTVVFDQLDPAVAGTDVTGTFTLLIPNGTTPTASLTGNENYQVTLELKDASNNWLAGDYNNANYNFTSAATTWTGALDTSWTNASNWSAGLPDQNSNVTISVSGNQPVIASNVNINTLTIATSASLTVNTGSNLSVTDAITNDGTLIIANNANLLQVNNVSNSGVGTTIVNRTGNSLTRNEYAIWSSPVFGQNLLAFSPATLTNRFYNYNETNNKFSVVAGVASVPFTVGSGYLIRMPDNWVGTNAYEGSFSGTPNNGNISKAVAYSGATFGYNMVGNPYPSTIDAEEFITANTTKIESSLYFWRKVNAAGGSAYAVYNPTGGTIASPSSALPNGKIQVGQGFIVKAKSGATEVNFTNEMRVNNTEGQFFKTKKAAKDRLWLNLTDVSGAFSQALIGYTADATSGVDMYDAKYINDSPVALTSSINSEEYSIQGRPAFDVTDVVALNFKTDVAGDYSIALDHFDGVFATGQDVYLVDGATGAETNLKEGAYTFNAAVGTDNTRFSLKFQKTLKVIESSLDENSVSVYQNNGAMYINSKSAAISSVKVFDVQGRLLAEQRNVKANTVVISNLRAKNQILIVNVVGEDNSEVSKKIMN